MNSLNSKLGDVTIVDKSQRVGYVLCRCYCGKLFETRIERLKNGSCKSCGCFRKTKLLKHGMVKSRMYRIWARMKARCTNPKSKDFKWYGGKGIKVCDEWNDFNSFYEWSIENGYKDDLTIDRIDNSKGYCPDNCRWVDMEKQHRNTTRVRLIEYNGIVKTIREWSEFFNIGYFCMKKRIMSRNYNMYNVVNDFNMEI